MRIGQDKDGNQTIIGKTVTVKGEILGSEQLVVEGTVEGRITIETTVLIREGGLVKADVDANNINIAGGVVGNIVVKDMSWAIFVPLASSSMTEQASKVQSIWTSNLQTAPPQTPANLPTAPPTAATAKPLPQLPFLFPLPTPRASISWVSPAKANALHPRSCRSMANSCAKP